MDTPVEVIATDKIEFPKLWGFSFTGGGPPGGNLLYPPLDVREMYDRN